MTTPRLRAEALVVSYGAREVLRGIDLDVRAGELLAFVGPNGAGKTTLLRALSGVLVPTRGRVLLDGAPLADRTRAEIARSIAVVPQDVPSAPGFTVRDVVAMGRAPHQGRWMRASDTDRRIVDEALQRAGLESFADRAFSALSGGERKRATIAQALAQSPEVLLLDEPSAFLDPRHALAIFELAREETARGVAVACVVHDLALAARYADRVALVDGGALARIGSPDEVLADEPLERAFGVPIRRVHDAELGVSAFAPMRR